MKARIKGTNDPFQEITGIEIDYAIYDPEVIEFENDFILNNTTTEDEHWQDVRERAAIAALGGLLADSNVQVGGNKIAQIAVAYADGLIKQLKKKRNEKDYLINTRCIGDNGM